MYGSDTRPMSNMVQIIFTMVLCIILFMVFCSIVASAYSHVTPNDNGDGYGLPLGSADSDSGSGSGIGGVASTLIKLVPILLVVSLLLVFIVPMVYKPN